MVIPCGTCIYSIHVYIILFSLVEIYIYITATDWPRVSAKYWYPSSVPQIIPVIPHVCWEILRPLSGGTGVWDFQNSPSWILVQFLYRCRDAPMNGILLLLKNMTKAYKINVVKIRSNLRLPITTWCVLFGWLPIPMDYHHFPHFNGHLAVWVYPIFRHSRLLSRSLEAAVQRPATWHHSTWRCSNGEPRDMALERVPKALTWFTICLICTYCNKTI